MQVEGHASRVGDVVEEDAKRSIVERLQDPLLLEIEDEGGVLTGRRLGPHSIGNRKSEKSCIDVLVVDVEVAASLLSGKREAERIPVRCGVSVTLLQTRFTTRVTTHLYTTSVSLFCEGTEYASDCSVMVMVRS